MIFVDGANLYECARQSFGVTRLDFAKVRDELVRGRNLVRLYYYNAALPSEEPSAGGQQQFFSYLRSLDYVELRLGKMVRREGGELRQKGVDVRMALDVCRYALQDRYDVAVVVSGDSDLVEAAVVAKDQGKTVENVFTRHGSSLELRQIADRWVELDQAFFDRCRLER